MTQQAWRQFTEQAGLVTYFRPLADARPMGTRQFELSVFQWETAIDDQDAAWNDTFVHPDSTHWLVEGSRVTYPGLMLRAGVSRKRDGGVYIAKNPAANYGFYGGQVQYNLVDHPASGWAASARASVVSLYGPRDLGLRVYGVDLLASKQIAAMRWAAVSAYGGTSSYLSSSREKSARVNLADERVLGAQAMVGVAVSVSRARAALEFNSARVQSRSLKVGFGF